MLVGNFLLWGESVPRVFANKKRPSLTNFPEIWGLSRLEPTDLPTGQCALPESFPGTEPSLPPTGQRAHLTSYVAIEPSLPPTGQRALPGPYVWHRTYVRQLVTAHFLDPTLPSNLRSPFWSVNWSPRTSDIPRCHRAFAATNWSMRLSESYVWHQPLATTNSSHVCQLVNGRPCWIIL